MGVRSAAAWGWSHYVISLLLVLGVPKQAIGAGDVEVFNLGDNFDSLLFGIMMTIVLAGLVVFDKVVELFEEHLLEKRKLFYINLLNRTFRELMILGLISFILFILKDNKVVSEADDETVYNAFEFVNLFLFFVGVSFVLAAFMLAMLTKPIKKRWYTYATVSLEKLLRAHNNVISKSWIFNVLHPLRFFKMLNRAQVIEYHLFRSVFQRLHRSTLTPAFDFSKYTDEMVDKLILTSFDFDWKSWLLSILLLFVTLPITRNVEGNAQVSSHALIIYGLVLVLLELICTVYMQFAYQRVRRRMGVEGGFRGVGKVLEELWVEPLHHFQRSVTSVSVDQIIDELPEGTIHVPQVPHDKNHASGSHGSVRGSTHGSTHGSARGSTHGSVRDSTHGSVHSQAPQKAGVIHDSLRSDSSEESKFSPIRRSSEEVPCNVNGVDCEEYSSGDDLWLPPGLVTQCGDMNGDPFVVALSLCNQSIKVSSYWVFKTLFEVCTLQKCYYCAFYFSYAIGKGIQEGTASAIILWCLIVPLPLLICLIPLSTRTIPLYAQLGTLQSKIEKEVVLDIIHRQEEAEIARQTVLSKLQHALKDKMLNSAEANFGREQASREPVSPRTSAIEHWFSEWDKDKNGVISRHELQQGIKSINIFLSEVELKELFRLADPDHSKSIDLEEFKVFLSDLKQLEDEGNNEAIRRTLFKRSTLRDVMLQSMYMDEEDLLETSSQTDGNSADTSPSSGQTPRGKSVGNSLVAPLENVKDDTAV